MEDEDQAAEELIHKFAAAIGELILWANSVDHQLTRALMLMLVLPDEPMVESVIAQLDPRPKAELLKKRAKLITEDNDWRRAILGWTKRAEKVQSDRNVVAHHQLRFADGQPVLSSSQLGKILASLTPDMKPAPPAGLPEILQWIDRAKTTFAEGENVLANLAEFAFRARRHQEIKREIRAKLLEAGVSQEDIDKQDM